jgi:hypothetical protein
LYEQNNVKNVSRPRRRMVDAASAGGSREAAVHVRIDCVVVGAQLKGERAHRTHGSDGRLLGGVPRRGELCIIELRGHKPAVPAAPAIVRRLKGHRRGVRSELSNRSFVSFVSFAAAQAAAALPFRMLRPVGLGVAWREAVVVFGAPVWVAEAIMALAVAIWLTLITLYTGKLLTAR